MGEKGAQHTQTTAAALAPFIESLRTIGVVSSRKMFGGYGIFESGVMFALVNSDGTLYFRVDESTQAAFEALQAHKHGRMPYFSVPDAILCDEHQLRTWAEKAAVIAHANRK